jgi:hypothetical protein
MSWIVILGIVVVVIALITLTGVRIKGGRPAGGTRLMMVARICLGLFLVILVLIALGALK